MSSWNVNVLLLWFSWTLMFQKVSRNRLEELFCHRVEREGNWTLENWEKEIGHIVQLRCPTNTGERICCYLTHILLQCLPAAWKSGCITSSFWSSSVLGGKKQVRPRGRHMTVNTVSWQWEWAVQGGLDIPNRRKNKQKKTFHWHNKTYQYWDSIQ